LSRPNRREAPPASTIAATSGSLTRVAGTIPLLTRVPRTIRLA
jgi:hypothetical protein